jgi:hypothetical protein
MLLVRNPLAAAALAIVAGVALVVRVATFS